MKCFMIQRRDIQECVDESFNSIMKTLPTDIKDSGWITGTFKVKLIHIDDGEGTIP